MTALDPAPRHWLRLALAAVVLGGAAALALLSLRPPRAAGADAPPDRFAAGRAADWVAQIARAPRPPGTAEHARVAALLERAIASLGLAPEVQEETVVLEPEPGSYRIARVRNVLARVDGRSAEDGLLLLVAHYDSVPVSPGAGDDASGVAALLETLRALRAGEPPEHDVAVLFSDAEEIGLLGARAFVEHHPWSGEVAMVANFEARGTGGPLILFETGRGTGAAAIRRYAAAAPRPVATSLADEVYHYLPHETDFEAFGLPGLNFAFIGGARAYHGRLDEPSRLAPATLQHVGATALALARDGRLTESGGPAAVYFNLPPSLLVVYPRSWALPLAALAVVGFAAAAWAAFRRGGLRASAALAAAGLAALAAALAWGLVTLLLRLWAPGWLGASPEALGDGGLLIAAWAALAAAAAAAVLTAFRRLGPLALAVGGGAWWAALAVASALAAPAASYLFAWPLLFAALAAVLLAGRRPMTAGRFAAVLLCAVPTLLLWLPALVLLGRALGFFGGAALALLTALATVLLAPQLALVSGQRRRWALPAAAGAVGLAVLVAASLGARHGPDRPRSDTLVYALDADAGRAVWASFDRGPDPWTSMVLGAQPGRETLDGYFEAPIEMLAAEAEELPLPAPELQVLAVRPAPGGAHQLDLAVRSPRGAPMIRVELRGPAVLRLVAVEGRAVEAADRGAIDGAAEGPTGAAAEGEPLVLRLFAPPPEGLRVTVETGTGELTAVVADRSYELPAADGLAARPVELQPDRFRPTDLTLVKSVLRLSPAAAPPDPGPAGAAPAR